MYDRHRKCILVSLAVLICLILALIIIFTHKGKNTNIIYNSNKAEVPNNISIPDNKLIDDRFREIFGGSFYLPEIDIYNPGSNGVKIFKPFATECYKDVQEMKVTQEFETMYSSTPEFYNSVAREVGISPLLKGKFTMGVTLNKMTNFLSSGSVQIKGMSIEISTYVKSTFLDENCFKSSKTEFTDDFMKLFDSLPVIIDQPWLSVSWQQYDTFLKTFGSHFVVRVLFGSSVRQWTFAKSSRQYDKRKILVKACINFNAIVLKLKTCGGITRDEYKEYKDLYTSNYLDIKGGTDETRNKFRTNKTRQLLEQILNEGREFSFPVGYKYKPIWDILLMKFYNNTKRHAITMNLIQYYYGFKDFGCTLQTSGNTKLRYFEYRKRELKMPIFQCMLINKGCHSGSDCHIGGAGTVTYCYGSSCYDYRYPLLGEKAINVVIRKYQEGSYDEGINNSCHYKAPFRARCSNNYFPPQSIWNGGSISKAWKK